MTMDYGSAVDYQRALAKAQNLASQESGIQMLIDAQNAYGTGYYVVPAYSSSGQPLPPERQPVLAEDIPALEKRLLDAAQAYGIADAKAGPSLFGGSLLGVRLREELDSVQKQRDLAIQSMTAISPNDSFGAYPAETLRAAKVLGINFGQAAADVPRVASVFVGEGGKVWTVMSNGAWLDSGQKAPANRKVEIDQRTGDLVSFNVDDPAEPPQVMQRGFAFPQIDPALKFKVETASAFAGLELQRRGQMVQAVGQDMANRIQLGRMEYDEAQLNLSRVDSAFTQRREDQKLALQYAVAKSSVFLGAQGEELTRAPLTEALAASLGISPDQFNLPVMRVNPDETARSIIAASEFNSPMPALQSQLEATRAAVSGLTSAPIVGADVLEGAARGG